MTTPLTEHFTLEELIRSDKARELGDANTPTAAHRRNLQRLAEGLEAARAILGRSMHVTSGYRNPRVNAAVGGVRNSAHALGLAADFMTPGAPVVDAARKLAASDLVFDQLIYEASRHVVHLSFDPRGRRQVLTQAKGPGTPVTVGIADV